MTRSPRTCQVRIFIMPSMHLYLLNVQSSAENTALIACRNTAVSALTARILTTEKLLKIYFKMQPRKAQYHAFA